MELYLQNLFFVLVNTYNTINITDVSKQYFKYRFKSYPLMLLSRFIFNAKPLEMFF